MSARLKIGTRGSPLALAQAKEVKAALIKAHNLVPNRIEIIPIKTSGDLIKDRTLLEEGGKGLFTKEIEDHLLSGAIDLAVHSAKDMPAKTPEGLEISSFLKREDPRDAFISKIAKTLDDLPKGAAVGTSSLRRQAQILRLRPDLKVIPFRGNVGTRLEKLKKGEVEATVLAAAGLNRLGLGKEIRSHFDHSRMLPAPGQGAIAVETRIGDTITQKLLKPLNHPRTAVAVRVERAVSFALGASCRMPLGAFAVVGPKGISAWAALFSPDGKKAWRAEKLGPVNDPEKIGQKLARVIMEKADPKLLQTFRNF